MPNNTPPVTDAATLAAKQSAARARARCDMACYLGAGADNAAAAAALAPQTVGLKKSIFDQTFGPLRLDDLGTLVAHAVRWPADRPCCATPRAAQSPPPFLPPTWPGARSTSAMSAARPRLN